MIILILSLSLTGLSSSLEEESSKNLSNEIYAIAKKKLKERHWKQAIIKLKVLENDYPFNQHAQNVQLNLIYAYYKNNNLSLAKMIIDRFMRLNPIHQNIDYVIYMRGLTNMALNNNGILYHLFSMSDTFDHDQKYIHDAFHDFSKLVHNYPNSQYSSDAIKRLIFLKNNLAEHEYSVADYYTRRGAWIAVINRVENMLRNYPDTRATRNGLRLMEHAYRQMQILTQASKVRKIISANESANESAD